MISPEVVFIIEKNAIIAKTQCSISIDEREYDDRTFIENVSKISLPGILQFYVPEFEDFVEIKLSYEVDLLKTSDVIRDKNTITITYNEGDTVLTKEYIQDDVDIGLLMRLLQAQIAYIKDPAIIFNMIHDILPSIDLVHFEVIVSNMFRQKDDPSIKCRISGNYKNSIVIGQNNQPYEDSWASAMAFQYINRAIIHGLVGGKDTDKNPIENVLTENFKGL